jgi:hypothetical protein
LSRTRNETSKHEWSAQFLQSSQKKKRTYCCIKIQKQECMKYEALGVMNSLKQHFEIDLQRKAKWKGAKQSAERRLRWVLPKP